MNRILVVDDSPVVCGVLTEWLRAAGYEVATAGEGKEALDSVASHAPDLILLDLLMPGMSGLDLCQVLKGDEASSRIPVVVLTAAGSSGNRIRSLELGAEDFLTKPVDHEELLARVRSLLRAKRLADRLLISFLELDKLGKFAETFTGHSITDWSDREAAASMAQHLLGNEPGAPDHPRALWAGRREGDEVVGASWCFSGGDFHHQPTRVSVTELSDAMVPFDRGDGQYLSKEEPPPTLCALLRLPASPALANFVALWPGEKALLAAGYPWEVGAYEFPLLRAVMRHWAVFERIRAEAQETEKAFFATMEALALAAEFYDLETARHVRRVSSYAGALARAIGCDTTFVKWIGKSSLMHDVGKITIPIELVRKPGLLDEREREAMKLHTVNGRRLLGQYPQLSMASAIAFSHHENVDGSGYPEGLASEGIPLEARIVRVADVYDALRTPRPYKPTYTHDQALEILRRGDERVKPEFFDQLLLQAFLDNHVEMAAVFTDSHDTSAAGAALRDPTGPGEGPSATRQVSEEETS